MKRQKAVPQKTNEKETLVADLQKPIDNAVILLLDLKNKSGITQGMKDDINNTVESLQETRRQLNDVLEPSDFLEMVFKPIKKLLNVWRKVFSD